MEQVIIIGGGPAGIACSVMLKHIGIKPLIIEKHKIGGLLRNAYIVKNYLGFPNGISGKDLVNKFKEQLKKQKITVKKAVAQKIDFNKCFLIKTDRGILKSKFVVIAAGTEPKKLNIATSAKAEKNIFYEVSDFPSVKRKRIAVIGAGDAAFDYALTLAKKHSVTILSRNSHLKCNKFLQKAVLKNKSITFVDNFKLNEITEKNGTLILCSNYKIETDFVVPAIGREPVPLEILPLAKKSKNLFLAGDFKQGIYRQSSIAAADGIKCAMQICKKLNG